ncbi:MAG: MaoC family dehydratase N-terminal domain-containing protein [Chloroflexota bacterium]
MTTEQTDTPAGMRSGDPNVTWDDTAKHIGEDYSGGIIMVADERVDKVLISRYCEPAEIGNLTYWDEVVARQAGFRSQVCPWAAVKEPPTYMGYWRPGQPTRFPLNADKDFQSELAARQPSAGGPPVPPTNAGFFTDMTIDFFEPVVLGDRLTTMGRVLHHVTPRETRVGVGAFIGYTSSYFNQFGELVAQATQGTYSFVKKDEDQVAR